MTKTIIMVYKGILLYTTMIATMLFIAGVDSIYDNGFFFEGIFIVGCLIWACKTVINEEELNTLLLTKYFGTLEEDDDEW